MIKKLRILEFFRGAIRIKVEILNIKYKFRKIFLVF